MARAKGHAGHARTPVLREDASFDLLPEDVEASLEATLEAQIWAGELLWIAERSRPDIAFVTGLVSSLCTRAPARATRVAQRVLSYLDTRAWTMRYVPSDSIFAGFGDASFAPTGGRSHGGWVVTARACPIVALYSVDSTLQSAGTLMEDKVLFSDSTSALAIQHGGSTPHFSYANVFWIPQLPSCRAQRLQRLQQAVEAELATQLQSAGEEGAQGQDRVGIPKVGVLVGLGVLGPYQR